MNPSVPDRPAEEPVLLVRRAGPDDAPAIADVLGRAFAVFAPRYTPAAFAATIPPADVVRARLAEGPAWVAEVDGAVVGTVAAVARAEGVYVRSMAVLPAVRGRGAGRALLAAVEAFAAERKSHRLFLSTTPFLDAAIALYTRAGFVRCADGPHDLHGTPLFTMEKRSADGPA